MNWNDTVTIGGREVVLTPEAGALVELHDGRWDVMTGVDWEYDEINDTSIMIPLGELLDEDESCEPFTPILPAVPAGCTREQVLGLIEKQGKEWGQVTLGTGFTTTRYLAEGNLWLDTPDAFEQADIPALKLAIQRYEALMAWWDANAPEVQNDTH